MTQDNPENPLEGKGDEMVPPRGMPFPVPESAKAEAAETPPAAPPEAEALPAPGAPPEVSAAAEAAAPEEAEEEAAPPENRFSEDELGETPSAEAPPEVDPELLQTIVAGQDSGMSAGFEVPEEEFAAMVGEPQRPPAVPEESARKGMRPLFDDPEVFEAPTPVEKARPEEAAPDLILEREANKALLDFFVTNDLMQKLWDRADTLAGEIPAKVENLNTARGLYNQLQSAKNLLLETRANYEEAERRLNEVAFQVEYAARTKRWSSSDGYWMYAYEILWAFILVGALIYLPLSAPVVNLDIPIQLAGLITFQDLLISVLAMLWGGLGGVFGALMALWKFVGEGKYNPAYRIWYYSQPIAGMMTGLFIFIFVKVGFNVTAGDVAVDVGNPFVIYILAWITGFQNKVVLNLVKQILKLFKIEDPDEKGD